MKIVIDGRFYGLENSGLGRYTINLINNLQIIDSENEYWVLLRKRYFDQLKWPDQWHKILSDVTHYSIPEQILIPVAIRKIKPDLVHFLHLNVPLSYNDKFIVTIHDLTMQAQGTNATTLPIPLYYAKRFPFKLVAKHASVKSTKIIVPTESVKNEVSNYYSLDAKKIYVTYEGVDGAFHKKFGDSGEFETLSKYDLSGKDYLFYIGNAYPHKNLPIVIESISRYNKLHSNKITFAVGGSRDSFIKRLESEISKYKANDFVKLLGYVADDELPVLYKKSLAFIYPSLSEGFGLQGLEALSVGTPLIASDIPVFREVYKDNAIFFKPLDFNSIIQSIDQVLNLSTRDREEKIKKGQDFVKKYSWKSMAEKTLEVYNSLSV